MWIDQGLSGGVECHEVCQPGVVQSGGCSACSSWMEKFGGTVLCMGGRSRPTVIRAKSTARAADILARVANRRPNVVRWKRVERHAAQQCSLVSYLFWRCLLEGAEGVHHREE